MIELIMGLEWFFYGSKLTVCLTRLYHGGRFELFSVVDVVLFRGFFLLDFFLIVVTSYQPGFNSKDYSCIMGPDLLLQAVNIQTNFSNASFLLVFLFWKVWFGSILKQWHSHALDKNALVQYLGSENRFYGSIFDKTGDGWGNDFSQTVYLQHWFGH